MRKTFAFFLTFIVLGFGVDAFLRHSCAQDMKGGYKKKDSRTKAGRILTVGAHGQLKGFNGLQMALNMAQDTDEIRIEKGIINGLGLTLGGDEVRAHGVNISGGWDETFSKNNDTVYTTLEGNGFTISRKVSIKNIVFKNNTIHIPISSVATFTNCIFKDHSTREGEVSAVNGSGVTFYNCAFTNNSARNGGAVSGSAMTFYNCAFTNNSARQEGGAVVGGGTFHNCTFKDNSADIGGAFNGAGAFYNCIFINNSAFRGGAVALGFSYKATFSNCIFANNISRTTGGAVSKGLANFNNCTLYGNKAADSGGAFEGWGEIINSIFFKNTAAGKANDIDVIENLKIDYSLFNYLVGGANVGENIVMGDPKFVDSDNGDFHLRSDSPCIGKGKAFSRPNATKRFGGKPDVADKGISMGPDEDVLTSALKDYQRALKAMPAKK